MRFGNRFGDRELAGHRDSQAGMTLIELMMAILLTAIICTMMLGAYVVTMRSDRQNSQDAQALAALRIVNDRLARDLREARRVFSDSTSTKIHFWVDHDRDNQQDPSERITFELLTDSGQPATSSGVPAKIVRRTDDNPGSPTLVSDDMQAFSGTGRETFIYQPAPAAAADWENVTLVKIKIAADEATGPYPAPRTLLTDLRLRNARTW